MRRKVAALLRRWADKLAPSPVEPLMELARASVHAMSGSPLSGSIKWLLVMRAMEKETGAKRRFINAAIDRAVLEMYGD